ncbi:MAG: aldolase/citrate lyase family protein [Planctomycetota bacterium]
MRENHVKKMLRDGTPALGIGLALGSVRAAEVCARAGFDLVMVDLLHGYFSIPDAVNALRAVATTGAVPFARVAANESARIGEVLDAGALGVVVPMVNSPDEARAAVRASFYPPAGERSRGGAVAAFYGDDYFDRTGETVSVVVMIETARGLENADAIAAVAGVDAVLIGSGDLALSLGVSGDSPAFDEAVQRISRACRTHRIAAGIAVKDPAGVRRWRAHGFSLFLLSTELSLLRASASDLAVHARKAL